MKLQPLYDLQQDINRLFVAGSKFAKGDPRLSRHVPVFRKLGERAPVFRKLAEELEELVGADTLLSPEKLTSISILLYSILYTQGESTEEGATPRERNEAIRINEVKTDCTYLQLKPVIQALTTSESGRLNVVVEAFESGLFRDFRVWDALNKALDDKFADLANYVGEVVIPIIGDQILPFILMNFSLEGRPGDIRRFRILYAMKYANMEALVQQAFESSSPALQAEAVEVLADDPGNEELIIKLANDKHKQVREAAYKALARLNTRPALEKLVSTFLNNKTRAPWAGLAFALRTTSMPFFLHDILENIKGEYQAFISMDPKSAKKEELYEAIDRLCLKMFALGGKDNADVFAFFEEVLTNDKYNKLVAKNHEVGDISFLISQTIANYLYDLPFSSTEPVFRRLEKSKHQWTTLSSAYFLASTPHYGKEKLFDTFGSYFKSDAIKGHLLYYGFKEERDFTFEEAFNGRSEYTRNLADFKLKTHIIDPRWMDLLSKMVAQKYDHHFSRFVIQYGYPESKEMKVTLVNEVNECIKSKHIDDINVFIHVASKMQEIGISERFELIYKTIANLKWLNSGYMESHLSQVANAPFFACFPQSYLPKFKALLAKYPHRDGLKEMISVIEHSK